MSSGSANEQARAGPDFAAWFAAPAVAAINHLLDGASWARDQLKPNAGKIVRFDAVPFTLCLAILESGKVAYASAASAPDVHVTFTPGVALRLLATDADVWQKIDVKGDTALAREILYVAQNLRWDVEEDLSRVVGDIAAHRMVNAAGGVWRWQRDSMDNFARATAAYWTEERPLVAARHDVERFVREVDALRDDAARLEKRIEQFASKHAVRQTDG
jgi:ubiquinone biosynthesis protein UbiJ